MEDINLSSSFSRVNYMYYNEREKSLYKAI
nr:MAG TPA: hypothetical protein [Caudoviricetes sp.]